MKNKKNNCNKMQSDWMKWFWIASRSSAGRWTFDWWIVWGVRDTKNDFNSNNNNSYTKSLKINSNIICWCHFDNLACIGWLVFGLMLLTVLILKHACNFKKSQIN